MIHQKKSRGHRTSKIVRSRQSSGNPIICLFYELARALMDDVVCEFACAVKDAQKQLARTSLTFVITLVKLFVMFLPGPG